MKFVIGVTGASGSVYADRLVETLLEAGHEVYLIQTTEGKRVCAFEGSDGNLKRATRVLGIDDFFAGCASGSWPHDGMVVIPCSMGTLAKLAIGLGDNLLVRAADVCLKERRKLIVVPRETPLNASHLENELRICRMGGIILPANPAFYHHPKTVLDLVDTVVARILDHLGVDHDVGRRWKEGPKPPSQPLEV